MRWRAWASPSFSDSSCGVLVLWLEVFVVSVASVDRHWGRRVRGVLGGGVPLEEGVRGWLEECFGVGLGGVRVHTGREADELARWLGAEAFAVGADVFFGAGRWNPEVRAGRVLLAHEVAHTVQAAGGGQRGDDGLQSWSHPREYAADRAARGAVAGRRVRVGGVPPGRTGTDAGLLVQCHSSWEHRMFGDCNTDDLDAIAQATIKKDGASGDYMRRLREFQLMWKTDPEQVTEQQIADKFPHIRTVKLAGSGLLVTYGELNTLADYLPEPAVLEAQPREVLLPILQTVRQEQYNKLAKKWLLDSSTADFKEALVDDFWGEGSIAQYLETTRLEQKTKNVGASGVGHYYGLLARNACHFAPYSWHRWYQYHMIARDYAAKSYAAHEGSGGENRFKAWLYHGYADHYLQDSFASGHLVNKTQVMQWFLSWAARNTSIIVAEWDKARTMTTALQPRLAPPAMYTRWPYVGATKDPETGQEYDTYWKRRDASGVIGDDRSTAYRNYLGFLTSAAVQFSTQAPHDFYCGQGLWVSSPKHPEPYLIWGDETMLTSGDGVLIASETAQLSQRAILNILGSGNDDGITTDVIRSRFPTKAGDQPNQVVDLQSWHTQVRHKCETQLFASINYKYWGARLTQPIMGKVSLDDTYAN